MNYLCLTGVASFDRGATWRGLFHFFLHLCVHRQNVASHHHLKHISLVLVFVFCCQIYICVYTDSI
jgi:hypothetical protein